MEFTASITTMLFLAAMVWQDFKTRFISAWLLPCIGILLVVTQIFHTPPVALLKNGIANCALLILQYIFLLLWISFKNRKWTNIIHSHIGLGDVVLLIILAPVFAPIYFCLLLTAGTLITLVCHSVARLFHQTTNTKIPFAGYIGLIVLLLCFINLLSDNPIVFSDSDQLSSYFLL
jgi:hypothetical protein